MKNTLLIRRYVLRSSVALMLLATSPDAQARSCQSIKTEERGINLEAVELLAQNPWASALTATCGLAAGNAGYGSVFMACAASACAATSSSFLGCLRVAGQWHSQMSRRHALAVEGQGC